MYTYNTHTYIYIIYIYIYIYIYICMFLSFFEVIFKEQFIVRILVINILPFLLKSHFCMGICTIYFLKNTSG